MVVGKGYVIGMASIAGVLLLVGFILALQKYTIGGDVKCLDSKDESKECHRPYQIYFHSLGYQLGANTFTIIAFIMCATAFLGDLLKDKPSAIKLLLMGVITMVIITVSGIISMFNMKKISPRYDDCECSAEEKIKYDLGGIGIQNYNPHQLPGELSLGVYLFYVSNAALCVLLTISIFLIAMSGDKTGFGASTT